MLIHDCTFISISWIPPECEYGKLNNLTIVYQIIAKPNVKQLKPHIYFIGGAR